jgi:hypothetical protein
MVELVKGSSEVLLKRQAGAPSASPVSPAE